MERGRGGPGRYIQKTGNGKEDQTSRGELCRRGYVTAWKKKRQRSRIMNVIESKTGMLGSGGGGGRRKRSMRKKNQRRTAKEAKSRKGMARPGTGQKRIFQ